MKRTILSYMMMSLFVLGGMFFSLQSAFADIVFNDMRELNLGGNSVKLYMGQDGNRFYLDSVNTSGKPLSCEIKTDSSILERGNCDDQYFSSYGSSEITIYVQVDNDQGTWKYNPSTRLFSSAFGGVTDVVNNNSNISSSLVLSANATSVNTSQSMDLTLRVYNSNNTLDTSFENYINFTISKKDNSGYYYSAASSDYVLNNSRYLFSAYDDGYVFLSSYLKFYTNGTYKITAQNAVTGKTSELIIYVGSASVGTIGLTTSTTTPLTNQYVTTYTTITDVNGNRNYNYQGTIRYLVERRDASNYNWYTANTNDYRLSPVSSYLSSTAQGYLTNSSHVLFYTNGYYRIKAYDDAGSTVGYAYLTVGTDIVNSSSNRFDLSANTIYPGKDNFSNLTIVAKDSNGYTLSSFNNRIRFQIYRRVSSSDSWTDITSSSLDNSAYRIYNTNYTFASYNNGSATITNFIKFYSDSYDYKVRVVDENNSNVYGEILYYVRNGSSNSTTTTLSSVYRFAGLLSPTVPSLNSYFDVKLYAKSSSNATVSNYTNTVNISLQRKILSSSTLWSNASSIYCKLSQTSYTFSSNNYGSASLSNLVRCSRAGFYRLKFVDSNNSSIYGYIYFTIVDENDFVSYLPGFTSSERGIVQEEYKAFMSKVNERELNNNALSRNSTWATTRKDYYTELNALAYGKIGKLSSYSAWFTASQTFKNDYSYLIR